MENKKSQKLSVVALIISVLPLATFIPDLFHITLSDGVRSVWAGANILFVFAGLTQRHCPCYCRRIGSPSGFPHSV